MIGCKGKFCDCQDKEIGAWLRLKACKVKIPAQRQIFYTSGNGLNPVSDNIKAAQC